MKKLLAVIAVLSLAVAVGFGQHINVINETGNGNVANTTQVFLVDGTFLPGNEAYTDQIGNGNSATIYQNNNGYAGSQEYAKIWQQGGSNSAFISQKNDGHDGFITQLGDDNNGRVDQFGNKSLGTVYEQGNGNIGFITINGSDGPVEGYIYQVGNANQAYQSLGQDYSTIVDNSHFKATQLGNSNYADQFMEGKGFMGGPLVVGNEGDVWQQGSGNYALQRMTLAPMGENVNNTAAITQYNNDNKAWQYQSGDGNSSIIMQNGNGNQAVSQQN